ncbi:hypothetical protein MLD38_004293 [Melastoma candidum]|uniref:Uncharacterized protein n=1 Tax=Melastoma candidum TaxID=119954 RepID=A0ACB9S4G6_9MYRT|nr:hypothetical protein MLD38_004293 [Melastoma candidum]
MPSSTPGATTRRPQHEMSGITVSLVISLWGYSVSGAACGKLNLTEKAITEGGFESLFRHLFMTEPDENLKESFACYFSTSTGPVAGNLYLSTSRSASPLRFTAPSEQEAWSSYYKVMTPISMNGSKVNPVVMRENPAEKYLQIVTRDGNDFWFMGFVNLEERPVETRA